MASPFEFTLRAIPIKHQLPSRDALVAAAEELAASSETWKARNSYVDGKVQIFSHKIPTGGPAWWCRVSTHGRDEVPGGFDDMWGCLGVDHALHEAEYVPEVKKATLLEKVHSGEVWTSYYTFSFPVSPRYFTSLIHTHITRSSEGPRTGYIISIPVNVSEEPELVAKQGKGVHGRYVSVETLKELENGKVEWRMATRSTPGGLIPLCLSESQMGSTISQDVPHFLKWLQTWKGKRSMSNAVAEEHPVRNEEHPKPRLTVRAGER